MGAAFFIRHPQSEVLHDVVGFFYYTHGSSSFVVDTDDVVGKFISSPVRFYDNIFIKLEDGLNGFKS